MTKSQYLSPKVLISKLLKQHNLGVTVGAVRDSGQRVQFYIMSLIFAQTSLLAYSNSSVQNTLNQYMPWFNFFWLIGFMVLFIMGVMLFDYKFILPSTWSFVNRQMYRHKNPLFKAFNDHKKELNGRLDEQDKQIALILEELQGIKKGGGK